MPEIQLNEEQQKDLLEFIKKRFKLMRDKREILDKKVQEGLDLYNAITKPKAYEWQSNLFVPYIFSIIRSMLPKLTNSLFGANQILSVDSKVEEFVHSEKKIGMYGEQKVKQMNLKKKARNIILASLKYPYAVAKMRWRYEVDTYTVKEYPKILGIPLKFLPPEDVEKTSVTYDDPDVEHIPYENFWVDPDATSLEEARDCIHRTIKDFNYLKRMSDIYMNLDKVKESTPPKDLETFIKTDDEIYYDQEDKGYNEVEVLEWYGPYEIDGEEKEIIVSIGNREAILRIRENDYYGHIKPFKLFTPLKEDSQLEGKWLPDVLKSLQYELNDKRNARMDNIKLILRRTYKVLRDADIDLNSLFSGPGNAVFVDDMNDIQEMDFKNIIPAIYNEESDIKNDMQQTSGSTDYSMGTSAGRGINATATGISIITSEASSRFKEMVDNLKDSFVELIEMMFLFLKQYKTDDDTLKLYERGEAKFAKVTLEELQGDYFFDINLKSLMVNKQLEQQTYINLLNLLGRFPWINVRALTRTILEKFEIKNTDEIMNFKQYQQEIQNSQLPGTQALNSPEDETPEQDKTPEQRITEIGQLGPPVNATLKEPVQSIPQIEQLKQMLVA